MIHACAGDWDNSPLRGGVVKTMTYFRQALETFVLNLWTTRPREFPGQIPLKINPVRREMKIEEQLMDPIFTLDLMGSSKI